MSLFGQPQSSLGSGSGFGGQHAPQQQSLFGQPRSTLGSGAGFGGQPASQQQSLFGQPRSTLGSGAGFGGQHAPQQQSLFGQPRSTLGSGSGFGGQQQEPLLAWPPTTQMMRSGQPSTAAASGFGRTPNSNHAGIFGAEWLSENRRASPSKSGTVAASSKRRTTDGMDNALLQRRTPSHQPVRGGGGGRRSTQQRSSASCCVAPPRFSTHFNALTSLLDAAEELAQSSVEGGGCAQPEASAGSGPLTAIRKLRAGVGLLLPKPPVGFGVAAFGTNGRGNGEGEREHTTQSDCSSEPSSD